MKLDEAIVTALEHENRVRDHYADAAKDCDDAAGKRFFEVLAREEQGHVEYLNAKLLEWRSEGVIHDQALSTAIPSREWVERGAEALLSSRKKRDYREGAERLFTALKLEQEVSEFYRGLVESVGPEGKVMFRRFLEIEDGHTSIVQAEIDLLQRTGYYYDFQEFNLED
jgi:rubrerythrin